MIKVHYTEFHKAVRLACQVSTKVSDMLTVYDIADYKRFDCYLSDDGVTGYAINKGELISVFSLFKGQGKAIVTDAINNGAWKLDCFDGYLKGFYESFGFKVIRREPNWTKGEPDVLFMRLGK